MNSIHTHINFGHLPFPGNPAQQFYSLQTLTGIRENGWIV